MKRKIKKMIRISRDKGEIIIIRISKRSVVRISKRSVVTVAVKAEKAARTTKMPTIPLSTTRRRRRHGSSVSSQLRMPQAQLRRYRPQQMTREAMDVAVATAGRGTMTMVERAAPSTTAVTSESTMRTRALRMVISPVEAVAEAVDATEVATATTKTAVDEAAELTVVMVDRTMVNTHITPMVMRRAREVAEAADEAVVVITTTTTRVKTEVDNRGVAVATASGIISKTAGRKAVQLPMERAISALGEENAKAT